MNRAAGAERIRAARDAGGRVFRNPRLRRLQLAEAGSVLGDWAYVVALSVFAFREGGALAVGVVGGLRVIPAALAAPLAGALADRHRRKWVMIASDVARAALLTLTALAMLLSGPPFLVYILSGLAAVASTAFGPAEQALLPVLCDTPDELASANAVSSTIASVGFLVGPAAGGLALAVAGPGVAVIFTAATLALSAVLVLGIRVDEPVSNARESRFATHVAEGLRLLVRTHPLRLVVTLYTLLTVVAGIVNVMIVVLALDVLGLGNAGVGYLNAAVGFGGLFGALIALSLTAGRLGTNLALGSVWFGLPLAALAIWPSDPVAFTAFSVVGAANTILGVASMTLLQRTVASHAAARVFGVLDGLVTAGVAGGSILAPALLSLLGVRGTLGVAGALPVFLAVALGRPLRGLDSRTPEPEYERKEGLLRSVPFLATLPQSTLERLISATVTVDVAPGSDVVREGERGDRFYVVADGTLEVAVDRHVTRTLGAGGYFGEIALLRDSPRTATVRAVTPVTLVAVDRQNFLDAVTAHPPSAIAAGAVAAQRLAAIPTQQNGPEGPLCEGD